MAKKKTEAKPVEATAEVTKPVRLDLTPRTHRLLRKVAADEGVSMAAFARERLSSLLEDEAKRRGIKP